MTGRVKLVFVACLVLLLLGGCGRKPTTASGTISGTVIDSTTGKAMVGVTIKAGDKQVKTDSKGRYKISDIAPGSYTLTATFSDYKEHTQEIEVVQGSQAFDILLISAVELSPSEVVMKFYTLANEGEITEAKEFVDGSFSYRCDLSAGSWKVCLDQMTKNGTIKNIEVKNEVKSGERIVVCAIISYEDGSVETSPIELLKKTGRWQLTAKATAVDPCKSE